MKNIISVIVLLLLSERALASESWVNVFVRTTQGEEGTRYHYTVQNKSSIPVTGMALGYSGGCEGQPILDQSLLSNSASVQSPSGWSHSAFTSHDGKGLVRWQGTSAAAKVTGFSIASPAAHTAIVAGFVCIYRRDAKVWQYKAQIIDDQRPPSYKISLLPAALIADSSFQNIRIELNGSDDFDTEPTVQLVSIRSTQAGFSNESHIKDADYGVDDRSFLIKADKPGLVFIDYSVTDAAGNSTLLRGELPIQEGGDRAAPTLKLTLTPNVLYDGSGFVTIQAKITVHDAADSKPVVQLVSITSNAKDFSLSKDVRGAVFASDDRSFQLLAKRSSTNDRTYTVVYQAKDSSGNSTQATANVVVKSQKSWIAVFLEALASLLLALQRFFYAIF